jgi:hypothetical protein
MALEDINMQKNRLLSGKRKEEMVTEWLNLIDEKVSKFISQL